jgi:hypothetical protein
LDLEKEHGVNPSNPSIFMSSTELWVISIKEIDPLKSWSPKLIWVVDLRMPEN